MSIRKNSERDVWASDNSALIRNIALLEVGANIVGACVCSSYFLIFDPEHSLSQVENIIFIAVLMTAALMTLSTILHLLWEKQLLQIVRLVRNDLEIPSELLKTGRRKILNLPFFSSLICVVTWTTGAVIMSAYQFVKCDDTLVAVEKLFLSSKIFIGIVISGSITGAIIFFSLEIISRKVWPHFFPEGRGLRTVGAYRLKLRFKTLLIFFLTSILPIIGMAVLSYNKAKMMLIMDPGEVIQGLFYLTCFMLADSLILVIIFSHIFCTGIVNPITDMEQAMAEIEKGNLSVSVMASSNDELGSLAQNFNMMIEGLRDREHLREQYNRRLREYNLHLEDRVSERTSELQAANLKLAETNTILDDSNKNIMASLRYAKLIQRSLLPNTETLKSDIPDSFFLWIPRELVGGDIYFTEKFEDGTIIAVIDCTGHGVPGAFMTMIACSGMMRIVRDEGCHDPADILKLLNSMVKTTLGQNTGHALSDDGLDAAVCFVKPQDKALVFAGAKLPLICIRNKETDIIRGDRQSIGYKRSDLNFNYTEHTVRIEKGMSFYMASDGFADQLGGKENRRMGTRHFKNLLVKNSHLPFEKQQELLIQAFNEYKGDNERQDDVTVAGFGF